MKTLFVGGPYDGQVRETELERKYTKFGVEYTRVDFAAGESELYVYFLTADIKEDEDAGEATLLALIAGYRKGGDATPMKGTSLTERMERAMMEYQQIPPRPQRGPQWGGMDLGSGDIEQAITEAIYQEVRTRRDEMTMNTILSYRDEHLSIDPRDLQDRPISYWKMHFAKRMVRKIIQQAQVEAQQFRHEYEIRKYAEYPQVPVEPKRSPPPADLGYLKHDPSKDNKRYRK